jgi:hypothetical protein
MKKQPAGGETPPAMADTLTQVLGSKTDAERLEANKRVLRENAVRDHSPLLPTQSQADRQNAVDRAVLDFRLAMVEATGGHMSIELNAAIAAARVAAFWCREAIEKEPRPA